jgi:hypothetical protein
MGGRGWARGGAVFLLCWVCGRFYPVSLSRPVAFMSLRVPMKRIILFVPGVGIIFLASAVQTFGTNWLDQA